MWIEIIEQERKGKVKLVTPFAGVWIEIEPNEGGQVVKQVTPFAGVWIEIVSDRRIGAYR